MDLVLVVALIAGALAVALCAGAYHLGGRVERRRRVAAERRALRCEDTLQRRIFREAVATLDRIDVAEGRAALNPSPPGSGP